MTDLKLKADTKTQTYFLGTVAGAALGLLASYLYSRANEEERLAGNEVQPLQVGQLLALWLAVLGIIRQISEMGRPSVGRKGRR
jgi:hypothetical protein